MPWLQLHAHASTSVVSAGQKGPLGIYTCYLLMSYGWPNLSDVDNLRWETSLADQIPAWKTLVEWPPWSWLFAKHFSTIFIYSCKLACLLVQNHSEELQNSEVVTLAVYCFKMCHSNASECVVASGKHFHTSHADFFPFPRNADTVTQPTKVWKIGRADDFSLPRTWAIVSMWMFKKCFPVEKKHTYISDRIHIPEPVKFANQTDHNISINYANRTWWRSIFRSIFYMENHSCVCLFVVAPWHRIVTATDQNIIAVGNNSSLLR